MSRGTVAAEGFEQMGTDRDIALVDAALEGDQAAFEELVVRYQRPIAAVVARMTGNLNDAADIAQQVFLRAYTKLSSFQRRSQFKTWLYSIAINLTRNELRRNKRWGIPVEVTELDPGKDAVVEDKMIDRQRRNSIRDAIDHLPPKQKGVVMLRIYEEMSFAEVAETMGINENTAKVNFHHAVKRLQGLLKDSEQPTGTVP